MRKIIAVVCVGLLSGVFVLSAQDAPKQVSIVNDDAHLRAVLPPGGIQMVSEYLLQNDPKKFEEMKKLRVENPEEFEKQMAVIAQKMREMSKNEETELKALSDKFRATRSDADKAALKSKLQELMGKRIEMQKRRIEEIEKNLVQLKANVADEEKKIDAKIEERIKDILLDKDARKDGPAK